MSFTSKLPNTPTSIFAVMSALARETGAINLSQGFPDFDPDPQLMGLVHKAMLEGHNQYAPMPGVPALNQQLSEKIRSIYGKFFDPDKEITITAGATQAIYAALSTLIHTGDEVIVIEPAYDSYVPAIRMNGGIPVYVRLRGPDFAMDWEVIRSKITPKSRCLIINTPHNPTGAVWSNSDWKRLERIAEKNDLFVISDEVYEHLVFDGNRHISILEYEPLMKRAIACFSFGKVFHNTGWKMGYAVASSALTKELRKVHQFMVFSCNTPVQYALAEFLKTPKHYLDLNGIFEKKRDILVGALSESNFDIKPAAGTYFQLANIRNMNAEGDYDFCVRLAREYGVATIPVSAFYHDGFDDGYIRLCFAKTDGVLREALKKLSNV